MSFSRRVLHMDPLPQARFEASSPTRRDTRFYPSPVAGGDEALSNRAADAKWPPARQPIIATKQHVKRYTQSVTDEPFLNRVLQVRILPGSPGTARSATIEENADVPWALCNEGVAHSDQLRAGAWKVRWHSFADSPCGVGAPCVLRARPSACVDGGQ